MFILGSRRIKIKFSPNWRRIFNVIDEQKLYLHKHKFRSSNVINWPFENWWSIPTKVFKLERIGASVLLCNVPHALRKRKLSLTYWIKFSLRDLVLQLNSNDGSGWVFLKITNVSYYYSKFKPVNLLKKKIYLAHDSLMPWCYCHFSLLREYNSIKLFDATLQTKSIMKSIDGNGDVEILMCGRVISISFIPISQNILFPGI